MDGTKRPIHAWLLSALSKYINQQDVLKELKLHQGFCIVSKTASA